MTSDNSSPLVQITGGTVNVQAMAVGDHATATVNNYAEALKAAGHDAVLAKLSEVAEALKAHGDALPDQQTTADYVERIAKAAADKAPDKLTLKGFLAGLADEVKSVAAIATTVTDLAGAVSELFI
jgi:hypothetical protein